MERPGAAVRFLVSFIVFVSIISCVHAQTADKGASGRSYDGMSREEILKIYNTGDLKEYKKRGNKEVVVFDDILSGDPNDTITFYMIDGRVRAWDKRKITFPDSKDLRSAVFIGMTKENLLKIYYPGNLKDYNKNGNREVMLFDDILSSDPDDMVKFYLVDGKVVSFEKSKAAPTPEATLEVLKERAKYAKTNPTYPSQRDDFMKMKQQSRTTSIAEQRDQRDNWYYDNGLHWHR